MIRRFLRPHRVAKLREARRDTRQVHNAQAGLKAATLALMREELGMPSTSNPTSRFDRLRQKLNPKENA